MISVGSLASLWELFTSSQFFIIHDLLGVFQQSLVGILHFAIRDNLLEILKLIIRQETSTILHATEMKTFL